VVEVARAPTQRGALARGSCHRLRGARGAGPLHRRPGGHISLIGLLSGAPAKPDPTLAEPKKLRIQPTYVGSRVMFEDMNRAIHQHRMKPVIDRAFPFAQANEALRYLESGGHFGKVVITV
jgi:NADPH:quinone reductase-like Zn-dependent oxidoreductase